MPQHTFRANPEVGEPLPAKSFFPDSTPEEQAVYDHLHEVHDPEFIGKSSWLMVSFVARQFHRCMTDANISETAMNSIPRHLADLGLSPIGRRKCGLIVGDQRPEKRDQKADPLTLVSSRDF